MSNNGAQELYRRFGFGPVGVRKNYYQEVNEDALVMWAHEVDQPEYAALLDGIEARHPGRDGASSAASAATARADGVRILGIETSCDETAAAVVEDGRAVHSSVVSSQVDLHARFGGVVPEIASRAHVELIGDVIAEALVEAGVELRDLDAVAACHGPGLAGALLVGVSAAKAISLATGLPYVGVNHLEAHLYAAWLEEPDLEPPLAVLIVSGGHTMVVVMEDHARYRVAGQTVDDAAGEAFDKVARFLGLGYPGGPAIDRLAATGDPAAIRFPRAMPGARRLLVRGAQDRGGEPRAAGARRAGGRRRGVVPGGGRRPARRQARGRGRRGRRADAGARRRGGGRTRGSGERVAEVAAATGRRAFLPPTRAVHRQRGDDRGRGLVAAAARRPDPARRRHRPEPRAPVATLTGRSGAKLPGRACRVARGGWYPLALGDGEC